MKNCSHRADFIISYITVKNKKTVKASCHRLRRRQLAFYLEVKSKDGE
jgi:hypothetical protein